MAIISPSLLLRLSCIVTVLVLMEPTTTSAFSVLPSSPRRIIISTVNVNNNNVPLFQLAMASTRNYGPRDDQLPPSSKDAIERSILKSDFIQLIDTIINGTTPEHEYPSLFTQNIDTIMRVIGYNSFNNNNVGRGSLLQEIMQDEISQSNENDGNSQYRVDTISDAIDMILTFVESFVEQTKSMDDVYKQLLGKIFQSIAPGASDGSSSGSTPSQSTSSANMENQLDNLLSSEKAAFTPGFLRHVEGECFRIASLSTISPESVKMLQILRLIQTRVLEELGKDIGEGAIVLGQLLGYEDESERLAVLDAGLTVRGVEFANELAALTEEALEGFEQASARENVDAELVDRVRVIDDRIRKFIGRWTKDDFQ